MLIYLSYAPDQLNRQPIKRAGRKKKRETRPLSKNVPGYFKKHLHFLHVLYNMWKLYNVEDDRPSYLPEETSFREAPSIPEYNLAIVTLIIFLNTTSP